MLVRRRAGWLRPARCALSLQRRLAAFVGAARGQQFVNLQGALFNQLSLRQFIARQRIFGDRPEVTALLAERVFEQQRVGVELLLNLFELERLRLGERGVMRAGLADGGLRPFVVVFKLTDSNFSLATSSGFVACSSRRAQMFTFLPSACSCATNAASTSCRISIRASLSNSRKTRARGLRSLHLSRELA